MEMWNISLTFAGNWDYLAAFRQGGKAASPKANRTGANAETEFVTFRGSVVDLESLMEKLEGSDASRALLENKLADMASQLGKWQHLLEQT